MMQDPVRCSDGHTYERAQIEKMFRTTRVSPQTRQPLLSEPDDANSLLCQPDEEVREGIHEFRLKKHEEQVQRKQDAEGDDEKRIFRQRYGLL